MTIKSTSLSGLTAVEKRYGNAFAQLRQGRTQDIRQARGLANETLKFPVHGALWVGLVVSPVAFAGFDEDSAGHETLELPLHAADSAISPPDDLTEVPSLVRIHQQQCQHGSADAWKQPILNLSSRCSYYMD
jgi:hypothetical protein